MLTVWPPTTTASDLERVSKTCCRDSGLLIQAACPMDVAILPSSVMAYFRMPKGLCRTARCSSACGQCEAPQPSGSSWPPALIPQPAVDTLRVAPWSHLVDGKARLLRQHLVLHLCSAASLAQHIHAHARGSQQPHRVTPQVGERVSHA